MRQIIKQNDFIKNLLPPVQLLPNTRYYPSQFVFHFNYMGRNYLYNTLTKECIEADLPESTSAGEGFDYLISNLFLVPEGKDEYVYYTSISSIVRLCYQKKGYSEFTILPTFNCNARCIYCYEEGLKKTTMTPETVKQTVQFIINNKRDGDALLRWFGGEPLLGVATIDHICDSLKEAGVSFYSTMTTNGSLITPEIVKKMKNEWNLLDIQISMDGDEEDYQNKKNYYFYRDYYSKVIDSINQISKAGIFVKVRSNIDRNNIEGIPNFICDLANRIEHKEKVAIYFCPLNDDRSGSSDYSLWSNVVAMKTLIQRAGFQTIPFGGNNHFRTYHCMADGNGVLITPDGNLHCCSQCHLESKFGTVFQGITDYEAKNEFCRVDNVREKCKKCVFLPECTSFSNCPIQDSQCFEVRKLFEFDYLTSFFEQNEQVNNLIETPLC